ncbi:MAG TPA: hypothetical protein VN814_19650 [Caulobacteraceae bacterium]|nr:hypothetical protein [Caulobacteraceae bacterium]
MPATNIRTTAHARQDPPWTDCGDPSHVDFGAVFATPVADGALCLTFDRRGRRHAMTLFDGVDIGSEIVIYGRRFTVVRQAGVAL